MKTKFCKNHICIFSKEDTGRELFLKKQSLLFTKAVLGFNCHRASNGRNQQRMNLVKQVLKLNFCRDRFFCGWGLGLVIRAPATHGNSKQIISS